MGNSLTSGEALSVAASSPLAMFGYLVGLLASAALIWRVRRNQNLLSKLTDIPRGDRKDVIQSEMGVVLPKSISAEQWLRARLHHYYFLGFLVIAACVTLVGVIAFTHTASATSSNAVSGATPLIENSSAAATKQVAVPASGPTAAGAHSPNNLQSSRQIQANPQPKTDTKPDRSEVWRATSIAASDPDLSITELKELFGRGFDVNGVIDDENNRALHLASERCAAHVVNWLLSQGADPNIPNKWRDTPLVIANARCGANNMTSVSLRPH